jgi:hypothetical protein
MKSDQQFLCDLSASRRAVNDFADKLRQTGMQVWLPPQRTRPDATVREQYADNGDLMVQGRVEHKVRTNLHFTSREDYPYPTVIVDEAYKVDAKADTPVLAYIIENASRTVAAVVYGWTRKHWQVEEVYDPKQGRKCRNYTVPKQHVRFCEPQEAFA